MILSLSIFLGKQNTMGMKKNKSKENFHLAQKSISILIYISKSLASLLFLVVSCIQIWHATQIE